MKKTILFTLLALLGMTQAVAQEYEYVPFVREGVKWVYFFINEGGIYSPDPNIPEGITPYTLELKGDTIINGKTYKAMHKYYGNSINWANDTVPVYLREEDKVVYAIVPDGRRYYDCPLGNHFFCSVDPYSNEEYVLYDFRNPEEFWNSIMNEYEDGVYEPCGNDTITVGHHKAKRHIGWAMGRDEYDKFYSIEGIGLDSWRPGTPLCFFRLGTPWPAPVFFSHVSEGGEIIYKSVYNYNPDIHVDIDETVADRTQRPADPNYYNLMGQPVGKDVPTSPGIYIHNGKKICVSRMQ